MKLTLIRNRDFMKLWTGATVSAVGTQISALAIPLTAIVLLKASAFEVGLLIAAKYLPLALIGLLAGAVADRVSRRTLLVACDLGRALVLASVPAAYFLHALSIWELASVSLVGGTLDVFFDVAHPAYVVGLVDRSLLVEANARLQLSEQGASTIGPALASLLIALVGGPLAVAVDAVSFLGSAVALLTITAAGARLPASAPRTRIATEIVAGLRFVVRHESLRALVAASSLTNLFLRMLNAVLLIRLARDAGLPAPAIGLVLSIGEAGFFVGSLVAAKVTRRFGLANTFTFAALMVAVSGLPVALAPVPLAPTLTALGLFVYGAAAVIWTINASAYRQTVTPPDMLGRVGAVSRVASWGMIPIASLIGGAFGAKFGAQPAMVIAAFGALLAPLPVVMWRWREGASCTPAELVAGG